MLCKFDNITDRLAKEWAQDHGYRGEQGGWIYSKTLIKPVCQGWSTFFHKFKTQILDATTREFSAFATFQALLDAKGGYRPTLRVDAHWQLLILATEYNREQKRRGDERRAYTPVWPKNFPEYMQRLVTNPMVYVGGGRSF